LLFVRLLSSGETMADIVDLLQELGFGEYEARAYHALLQHNPISGYELAKVSGIPRPNIYAVLQKLEERGTVGRLQRDNTTLYVPVAPEEFLARIGERFQATLESAQQALQELAKPPASTYVWNVQGHANLLAQAGTLIDDTSTQLLLALWPDEAASLANQLDHAETRGVEITTLCLAACPQECGGCRGRVYRYKVVETLAARWLMVVPDAEEVLIGEIVTGGETSLVRTRQRLLIAVTSWFIWHSIALAVLLLDAGEELDARLDEHTRAALMAVGPFGAGGWLAYMRRLLGSAQGLAHTPPV
jgi:HTH-type transcriptional regulator, sugar sensing transcriptional regulator